MARTSTSQLRSSYPQHLHQLSQQSKSHPTQQLSHQHHRHQSQFQDQSLNVMHAQQAHQQHHASYPSQSPPVVHLPDMAGFDAIQSTGLSNSSQSHDPAGPSSGEFPSPVTAGVGVGDGQSFHSPAPSGGFGGALSHFNTYDPNLGPSAALSVQAPQFVGRSSPLSQLQPGAIFIALAPAGDSSASASPPRSHPVPRALSSTSAAALAPSVALSDASLSPSPASRSTSAASFSSVDFLSALKERGVGRWRRRTR
jgi:hypothetical protein